MERQYGRKLTKDMEKMLKDSGTAIAIPRKIHQKCSETYGGKNSQEKQWKDADNIKFAVDSNFDAIENCLRDQGVSQLELDKARRELHEINQSNGWY